MVFHRRGGGEAGFSEACPSASLEYLKDIKGMFTFWNRTLNTIIL